MRACLKASQLLGLLLAGLLLALLLTFDRRERISRERLMRWWCRRLVEILDVRIEVIGKPSRGDRLIVANHVSWLDIPVIGALEATRFVSRSEVRQWPIAGQLANGAGTFYIRRGKGGAAPLLRKLIPFLRAGGTVAVFPEGTTTDGCSVKPFHPRLFAAAIDSGCKVQPLALHYARSESGESVAPFIGDDDLASHILRVLREPSLTVQVAYLPAIAPLDFDRDELAFAAETGIRRVVAEAAARRDDAKDTLDLPIPERA